MTIKKLIGQVHLWLGFTSGLLVLFLGITGCMLAFEHEISLVTKPYQFVEVEAKSFLPPSVIKEISAKALPGKVIHGIAYRGNDKAVIITYYHANPDYYYLTYVNPYSGEVLKVSNMDDDFFRIIVMGHYYLWLPPEIGQPIVASATLIFLIMMITGIILWWPKNRAARKQRFSIKWNAKWRRVNYDLHNVFGFYMTWVGIFLAITGLVMGFQWFSKSVYWITSGGKQPIAFYAPNSDTTRLETFNEPVIDVLWKRMSKEYPDAQSLEVHVPESDSTSIEVAANPDDETYWKAEYRYFDQYTAEEIPVKHMYGKMENTSAADKIARMNYDIHVGALLGLPGKILAVCGSLICASLPVTGFYIWWGRRKKKKDELPLNKLSFSEPEIMPTRKVKVTA